MTRPFLKGGLIWSIISCIGGGGDKGGFKRILGELRTEATNHRDRAQFESEARTKFDNEIYNFFVPSPIHPKIGV